MSRIDEEGKLRNVHVIKKARPVLRAVSSMTPAKPLCSITGMSVLSTRSAGKRR
jgi:hypothetical protein